MNISREKRDAISEFLIVGFILSVVLMISLNFGIGIITSGSMEPTLHRNDFVIIKKTDDLKVGDMAVYESDDEMIVHRIIDINGDDIITKGDANNVADEPISIGDVKGVVVGKIKDIPINFGTELGAKYVSQASGSSKAEVARWDVSALDEQPGVLEVTAGDSDYGSGWYEFTVNSDSETSAEYSLSILVHSSDDAELADTVTEGLFKYDDMTDDWELVEESSSGELYYSDALPMGWTEARFRLKFKAEDDGAAGDYLADINVDVTQLD